MEMNQDFWRDKRVLITGHTGFKGSWLFIWLESLGANVSGYSLAPDTTPNLFDITLKQTSPQSFIGDLGNYASLSQCFSSQQPEIVFHLAAQSLVRESYQSPQSTYATNVMGTMNVLEACRQSSSVRSVVIVTTDKCYENKEWPWGYRETDQLGGYDPYSSSKACVEILTASYRSSFFHPNDYEQHKVAIATARAGNVIGGGDWAKDRLVPDTLNAIEQKQSITLRYPNAIRPWQHVLEPLSGYLTLAQKLYTDGTEFSGAWNFGPSADAAKTVSWITHYLVNHSTTEIEILQDTANQLHESYYLKLDCSMANEKLKWFPRWNIDTALSKIVEWTVAVDAGEDARSVCLSQINEFTQAEGSHR